MDFLTIICFLPITICIPGVIYNAIKFHYYRNEIYISKRPKLITYAFHFSIMGCMMVIFCLRLVHIVLDGNKQAMLCLVIIGFPTVLLLTN